MLPPRPALAQLAARLSTRPESSRFRKRDSMGALRPRQAELDGAYANGYVHGIDEAQEAALDQLRTLLMQVLEKRFDCLDEQALSRIADADAHTLQSWILRAMDADSPATALV